MGSQPYNFRFKTYILTHSCPMIPVQIGYVRFHPICTQHVIKDAFTDKKEKEPTNKQTNKDDDVLFT